MLRFILKKDQRCHLNAEDFVRLKFLNIEKRHQYLNLCMMYSIENGTCPNYLLENMKRKSQSYNTRHNYKSFVLPHVNSQGKLSFIYNGIKQWNDLPKNIKAIENKTSFKRKCKQHLLTKMLEEERQNFI